MRKEERSLMASLSTTSLIWLSPTNKTEYLFGVFALFVQYALCTFERSAVALSGNSYRLSKSAKLFDILILLISGCFYA